MSWNAGQIFSWIPTDSTGIHSNILVMDEHNNSECKHDIGQHFITLPRIRWRDLQHPTNNYVKKTLVSCNKKLLKLVSVYDYQCLQYPPLFSRFGSILSP